MISSQGSHYKHQSTKQDINNELNLSPNNVVHVTLYDTASNTNKSTI